MQSSETVHEEFRGDVKYPVLDREVENELFLEYRRTRDIRVRDRIFFHNRRLVPPIAGKYLMRSQGMEFKDLVQEGNLGVFKAIEHFSPDRDIKFSTFATLVIGQSISKSITDTGRWTRIPADILTMMRRMIDKEKEYKKKHGRFPDYDTLRGIVGMTEATFRTVFHARKVSTIASFDEMLDRLVSGEKRDDLQIEDILHLATDETAVGHSALLEAERLSSGVTQIRELVRSRYSAVDSEIYLRLYGFHDGSFKREKVTSLCTRFGRTAEQVEHIRRKCIKCVKENIPGVTLCDFSEERFSALVELALAFL